VNIEHKLLVCAIPKASGHFPPPMSSVLLPRLTVVVAVVVVDCARYVGVLQVASSEFKKLFLRLEGDPDWMNDPWWKMRCGPTAFPAALSLPRPSTRNFTTLRKLERSTVVEILKDETFVKGLVCVQGKRPPTPLKRVVDLAAFFRHPLNRLISCYLDKFVPGTHRAYKYSIRVFQGNHTLSFDEVSQPTGSLPRAWAVARLTSSLLVCCGCR
jgi:hypothetical protein